MQSARSSGCAVVASSPTVPPDKILSEAAVTLRGRGIEYDGKGYAGGVRSMAHTVEIFEAWTGNKLSEADGWRFMMRLKMALTLWRIRLHSFFPIRQASVV